MEQKLNNENQGEIIKQFPKEIKDDTLVLTRVVKKGKEQEVQFFYRCGHLNNEPTFCKFSLQFSDLDFSNTNSKEEIIKTIDNRFSSLHMSFNIVSLEQIKNNYCFYKDYNFTLLNCLKNLDDFFIQNLPTDCHPLHSFIFFLKEKPEDMKAGLIFSLNLLDNTLKTENNDLTNEIKTKLNEFIIFLNERQQQKTLNDDDVNKIKEKFYNILLLTRLKTKTPEGKETEFEGEEINNNSCCSCKGCSLFSCCRPCGCCKGS